MCRDRTGWVWEGLEGLQTTDLKVLGRPPTALHQEGSSKGIHLLWEHSHQQRCQQRGIVEAVRTKGGGYGEALDKGGEAAAL